MDILRLNEILRQSPYLTKQNLSLALDKEGENLNYWIKKFLKEKTLISLKKGFYISSYYLDLISQNPQDKEAYLEYLANVLRYPSYISLEYVLSKQNFLAEASFALTSVTTKTPRLYDSAIGRFIYRNIKKELFSDYSIKEFGIKQIRIADLPKALFDFLYLKEFTSQEEMRDYLIGEGRLNWKVLLPPDKRDFIRLAQNSGSKKMKSIMNILRKRKVL